MVTSAKSVRRLPQERPAGQGHRDRRVQRLAQLAGLIKAYLSAPGPARPCPSGAGLAGSAKRRQRTARSPLSFWWASKGYSDKEAHSRCRTGALAALKPLAVLMREVAVNAQATIDLGPLDARGAMAVIIRSASAK